MVAGPAPRVAALTRRRGGLGVDAIGTADLVLVPALAVAHDGIRLGRGGGSYDRVLPRRRASVAAAALLYDDEVVDVLPRDDWDQPVDLVFTPAALHRVGRNTGADSAG